MTWSRRAALAALATGAAAIVAAPALIGLSRKSGREITGGFVDDDAAIGHRLRHGAPWPTPTRTERVPVVIVGGGIAGLSAAWQLERRGYRDFVLLEMAARVGGNARWGENDVSRYPWAAHYLPVPGPQATYVRELCQELGLLRDGVWDERHLCFSQQERLFIHGEWRAGIEPTDALDARGRDEFRRFADLVSAFRAGGAFTIPSPLGRLDGELDRRSFTDWLTANDFRSRELRWYLAYACRDDYGASPDHTSAWAGIHYFASRPEDEMGPLTWPEGNGWIVERLLAKLSRYVRVGAPVHRIAREGTRFAVSTPDARYQCDAVIVAAPLMLMPRILEGSPSVGDVTVSPWLVANLTLDRLPKESGRGTPIAWDNVIYDSPSLGYVDATHQSLAVAREKTVWTWYHALSDDTPAAGRTRLRDTSWRQWVEWIMADLRRAHPDIGDCVTRIDLKRHAHAMIRPTPGFLSGATRERFLRGEERLYFAHSDVSGLSLFEEAQYRGVIAADRALAAVGR